MRCCEIPHQSLARYCGGIGNRWSGLSDGLGIHPVRDHAVRGALRSAGCRKPVRDAVHDVSAEDIQTERWNADSFLSIQRRANNPYELRHHQPLELGLQVP